MLREQAEVKYVMMKQEGIALIWIFAIVCKKFPAFCSVDFSKIVRLYPGVLSHANFPKDT